MIEEIRAVMPAYRILDDEREFVLREWIRFGMTPEEVIRLEGSRGFRPREEGPDGKKGPLCFSGMDYRLYYEAEGSCLAGLPLSRFEYDFSMVKQRLYQFSYVFKGKSAFFPLSLALQAEYGPPNNRTGRKTVKYTLTLKDTVAARRNWIAGDGEENQVLIDLWLSGKDTCTLSCETWTYI